MFFGNEAQVANIKGNLKNSNWVAFHTKDVIKAKELLHVISIKITSLYIGEHSGGASRRLVTNPDDESFDWMAKGHGNDNYRFSANNIEQYDNTRNDNTWKNWYKVVSPYFEEFKSRINMISDEGSLTIGGCRTVSSNGLLFNAIYEWSLKKINIFGNIDQTSDNPNVLDNPISMGVDANGNKYHYEGWRVIGPKSGGKFLTLRTSGKNTGQIRLQSTGEPAHIVTKDE